MPRPTPVQLVYGSATVVCSALAMLVLSRVQSGPGLVLIAVAALAAGVLVAMTAPGVQTYRRARAAAPVRRAAAQSKPASRQERPNAAGAARRVAEPSLRS